MSSLNAETKVEISTPNSFMSEIYEWDAKRNVEWSQLELEGNNTFITWIALNSETLEEWFFKIYLDIKNLCEETPRLALVDATPLPVGVSFGNQPVCCD